VKIFPTRSIFIGRQQYQKVAVAVAVTMRASLRTDSRFAEASSTKRTSTRTSIRIRSSRSRAKGSTLAVWRLVLLLVWTTATTAPAFTHGVQFRFPGRRRDNTPVDMPAGSRNGEGSSSTGGRDPPVLVAAAGTSSEDIVNVAASIEQAAAAAADYAKNLPFLELVPEFVKGCYHQFVSIVLYKPPVGIVACYTVFRLLWTGRILRLYPKPRGATKDSVEDEVHSRETRKRNKERLVGRSLILDTDDVSYNLYGGVERVRRRLCGLALTHLVGECKRAAIEQELAREEYVGNADQILMEAAVDLMTASVPPGSARASLVQEMVEPIARLEHAMLNNRPLPRQSSSSAVTPQELRQLIMVASMTAQVRAMDALLRVCRDRLLKTAYRMARTRDHWKRRVRSAKSLTGIFKRLFNGVIEGDRLRLAYATAAYNEEVYRLGKVAAILMERPKEMSESYLLQVLKSGNKQKQTRKEAEALARANEKSGRTIKQQMQSMKISEVSLAKWSKYSLRWNPDGRGFPVKILKADMHVKDCWQGAVATLLAAKDNETWLEEASTWTSQARRGLCGVLKEVLHSSDDSRPFDEREFLQLEHHWCAQTYAPNTDVARQWQTILDYSDDLASYRRAGEGRAVQLIDAAFFGFARKLNIFGLPKAMLTIGAAHYIHEWASPQWPNVKKDGIAIAKAIILIIHERFWVPIKGIWDELMHKNQGMMSALSVDGEQASLDHMLRDLGYGDGTARTRNAALVKAAEEYEKGLDSGVVRSVVGGKLVRLMLVQVQQLKVGLLSALGTIDTLMKGNQIHFQVLASIPAIVIATYGTRFFFRALYNIRSRDLRPISVAHAEMSNYLANMEAIIVLADQDVVSDSTQGSTRSGRGGRDAAVVRTNLQPSELGELLLNMHRYIVLLDYGSPPFPVWLCDAIHSSLQELLGGSLQRLDTARHISWLNLIQKKHQELLKR